ARRKGVTVRVVADSKSLATDDSALEMLMNGNDELPPLGGCDGGCVSVCRAGCHGFHINHNKFLLLSELEDGSRWVVAQSSANFTAGQHRNYNDLLVFHNDRELYATFEAYFDDLDRRLWSPRYYREEETTSGIAVHFFPRLFGPDPIVDILDSVQCDPGSTIRVAHSRFESFRLDVARKLRELSDQGCDVHAILRREPRRFSPGRAVLGELDELATVLPYKGHDIDGKRNAIHTKLMLIKAPHGGSEEPRHLVLTGSHNLSVTSLHLNDEVLLRVDNAALFAAYEKFWDEILQAHEQR
ncbi:MAG: phospholipase D-like domain-containing protein, partial [Pseudomonadota bacterium]